MHLSEMVNNTCYMEIAYNQLESCYYIPFPIDNQHNHNTSTTALVV